jgi:hypothetical protein
MISDDSVHLPSGSWINDISFIVFLFYDYINFTPSIILAFLKLPSAAKNGIFRVLLLVIFLPFYIFLTKFYSGGISNV